VQPSGDPRVLPVPGAGSSIAAAWDAPTSFTVDVHPADGQAHELERDFLGRDQRGRTERVQISDATTGAVPSTPSVSSFPSGMYLDSKVSGNIVITITDRGPRHAVLSGLFLDPSARATPTSTWASPASIVYGTPLSSAQLDATASVPGTFTYTAPCWAPAITGRCL
jgi:hypothetical protein